MQAKKSSIERRSSALPASPKGAAPAETQLNLILNEIQSEQDFRPQLLSFRHTVARALRGYKLTDLLAIALGFAGAWSLAVAINAIFFGRYDLGDDTPRDALVKLGQLAIISACLLVWFTHDGHYRLRMPFWVQTKKIIEAMGFAMLVDTFLHFVSKQDFSRLWLISGWVFATTLMIVFRAMWRAHQNHLGLWKVPTLLLGCGDTAHEARRAITSETGLGFDIVAQIDNLPTAFKQAGHSWKNLCAAHKADYVIIALDGVDLMHSEQAFAQLMREDVPFSVSPPMHNIPVFGMVPQYFFNHDIMLLTHNHGLNQRLPRLIKRTFDIVVASSALLVLSPLLLLAMLFVKMDGGPALFGHKRLGLQGTPFSCLKFRSMITNSDAALKKYLSENADARAEWLQDHKLRNDPRVTRFGKFMRRTSIDELPQLFNVLKGDMSIVGPRPIIVAETEKYDNDISHYYRVRPGITGLWQVSGRNDVSYAQRVRMDSWYVRNWSLWHDIAIIFKTIPVVLNRDGAY